MSHENTSSCFKTPCTHWLNCGRGMDHLLRNQKKCRHHIIIWQLRTKDNLIRTSTQNFKEDDGVEDEVVGLTSAQNLREKDEDENEVSTSKSPPEIIVDEITSKMKDINEKSPVKKANLPVKKKLEVKMVNYGLFQDDLEKYS